MNTLTLKLPVNLDLSLTEASQRAQLTKSELVRRALAAYLSRENAAESRAPSALAQAGDLVGCFGGGPSDLSSNPRHLDGFGKT
jgi:predicted transcriptional regulator